ncbi:MAG: DUF454 family protein [Clostridia bacterium]|nr:DUF454 family protein [Clostridia bacterium]
MKRIICLILAAVFLICGIIGVLIPIVPQIPFFIMSVLFGSAGSQHIKTKVKKSRLYNRYMEKYVKKIKILSVIFEEKGARSVYEEKGQRGNKQ